MWPYLAAFNIGSTLCQYKRQKKLISSSQHYKQSEFHAHDTQNNRTPYNYLKYTPVKATAQHPKASPKSYTYRYLALTSLNCITITKLKNQQIEPKQQHRLLLIPHNNERKTTTTESNYKYEKKEYNTSPKRWVSASVCFHQLHKNTATKSPQALQISEASSNPSSPTPMRRKKT